MGTDIHMVAEKRIGDRWVGAHAFDRLASCERSRPGNPMVGSNAFPRATLRNYALFGDIANVRRASSFGLMPRGIPADASDLAQLRIAEWGADGHSHSWLTVEEALPHFQRHVMELGASSYLSSRDQAVDYASALFGTDDDLKDWRLVFWFDN